MNAVQSLDYFLSYAAYDNRRTQLNEREHYEWVVAILQENVIYTKTYIYEEIKEDKVMAAASLSEMIRDMELLVAKLPGDGDRFPTDTVHDEIKHVMENLLDFMEDRALELEQ